MFTYDALLNDDISRVRFLLQDTSNTAAKPALLDDGEIAWAVREELNIYYAAAICAETLAVRSRGVSSKSVGGLSIAYGNAAVSWSTVADRLRARGDLLVAEGTASAAYAIPSAGGIYDSDRESYRLNLSLIKGKIWDGIFEDVGTSNA